jgi:2'-5' RNA ligase
VEDILISYGNSIKAYERKGDLVTVGAYGILWGDPSRRDLVGDYFTKSTFLGARGGLGVDTMLHHGIPLSSELKAYATELLPPTVKAEDDDTGRFIATILDLRNQYQKKVFKGIEEEAFAWSSGANPRGVRRANNVKTGEILQWPIMEFSFTPTPCEPRLFGSIMPLKSLPQTMLEEPNFVKAVRVLADFDESGNVKFSKDQPRDEEGKWTAGSGVSNSSTGKSPKKMSKDEWTSHVKELAKKHSKGDKELAAQLTKHTLSSEYRPSSLEDADASMAHFASLVKGFKKQKETSTKSTGPFDYCSTQVNLPDDAAKAVREWAAKLIPDEVLAEQGREAEPHITVLYGLHNDEPEAAQKVAAGFGSITVKLGEVDVFEADGYDVVFLDVKSPDLANLHEKLVELEHTKTHPEYHPHLTLAYVKSGEGAQFKGAKLETLDELTFDGFAFSDKEGNLTKIETKTANKSDSAGAEIKAEIFTGVESRMASVCLRELIDELQYRVLWEALNPPVYPNNGVVQTVASSAEERLAYVRRAFQEFTEIGLSIVESLMKGEGDETAEDAAKSLNPYGQTFWELEAGLRAGLRFSDHSEKVLAASTEFHNRVADLLEDRAQFRKAGRVLSQENHQRLSTHLQSLQELTGGLKELLETHGPKDETVSQVSDASGVVATKTEEDDADLDAAIFAAELRFLELNAQMLGVPVE